MDLEAFFARGGGVQARVRVREFLVYCFRPLMAEHFVRSVESFNAMEVHGMVGGAYNIADDPAESEVDIDQRFQRPALRTGVD